MSEIKEARVERLFFHASPRLRYWFFFVLRTPRHRRPVRKILMGFSRAYVVRGIARWKTYLSLKRHDMAASDLEHGLARDRLTHNHGENAFHIVFRKKFRSYLVWLCIHSTKLDSYRTGCILASLFRNDKPREIVFRARWLAKIYASCVIFSRIARRGLSSHALYPRQKLQCVECDKHRNAALLRCCLFTHKLCNIFYVRKYRNNTLARTTIMFLANFCFLRQRKKKKKKTGKGTRNRATFANCSRKQTFRRILILSGMFTHEAAAFRSSKEKLENFRGSGPSLVRGTRASLVKYNNNAGR